MKQLAALYRKCRKSESSFLIVVFRFLVHKLLHGKALLLHQRVSIRGLRNISHGGRLEVGISYVGFSHRSDTTLLRIKGKLQIADTYSIGRGCRIDVGEKAVVSIGKGGYINNNTKMIIMHGLSIGDQCAISWDCQFLDEDFHSMVIQEKRTSGKKITIGNHVWIGCGAKIYKGTVIPDGCVVASDSVVKGVFTVKNAIIAGNPAKVVKEDISWE